MLLGAVLAASCAVGVFAKEESTTLREGDADGSGSITAADARALARSIRENGDKIYDKDYDFNMDGVVNSADVGILLRSSAFIMLMSNLSEADSLAIHGKGYYDKVLFANGKSYSVAEYNYYYSSFYMSYAQQSYNYDYYYGAGYGAALTGFDYTVAPDEQYFTSQNGERMLFSDYFHELAISTIEQYSYYAMKAKQLGLELTEEDYQYIDENMQSIKATALQYGMYLDELLEEEYGKGVNSYIFDRVIKDQLYAQKYQEYIKNDFSEKITDEEIDKHYKDNPSEYNSTTLRAFRLAITTNDDGTTDAEHQQAAAKEFTEKVKDEQSFLSVAAETDPLNFSSDAKSLVPDADYSTISQYVGEDAAKWAFDLSRKTGDMQIFSTNRYIYVLFTVTPPARNEDKLPSVRHILISYEEAEEGTDEVVTNANGSKVPNKKEAYKLAEKYLAEYKRGAKTEKRFAQLAEKYSEDTNSLSSGQAGKEGGLYSDIRRGEYVEPFENWAYDEARQVGDTDIIETDYGYHIMYFCGSAEEPYWKATIKNSLTEKKTTEFMHNLSDKYSGTADYDSETILAAKQHALDSILDARQ